jgi:hypothetical protein
MIKRGDALLGRVRAASIRLVKERSRTSSTIRCAEVSAGQSRTAISYTDDKMTTWVMFSDERDMTPTSFRRVVHRAIIHNLKRQAAVEMRSLHCSVSVEALRFWLPREGE